MKELLQMTGDMMQDLFVTQLNSVFTPWKPAALFTKVVSIAIIFLNCSLTAQLEAAGQGYRLETIKSMTYDAAALKETKAQTLKVLRQRR